jgi:hypothetical protein
MKPSAQFLATQCLLLATRDRGCDCSGGGRGRCRAHWRDSRRATNLCARENGWPWTLPCGQESVPSPCTTVRLARGPRRATLMLFGAALPDPMGFYAPGTGTTSAASCPDKPPIGMLPTYCQLPEAATVIVAFARVWPCMAFKTASGVD